MADFFENIYTEHGVLALIGVIVLILAAAFGLLCLEAWLAMALWNSCAVPVVSILSEVSFWQMFGITMLCNILFNNVRGSSKKD